MKIEGNTIYSENGKILRRISDKMVAGDEYHLGYTYYIGDKMLATPHLEVVEDFEELTEEEVKKEEKESIYKSFVEKYIRERYSISDELAIQRQKETKKGDFEQYDRFCEECKLRAKQELELE